jgi:hypothetical protein
MQVQKSGRYANLQAGEKQKKDDGCCWDELGSIIYYH